MYVEYVYYPRESICSLGEHCLLFFSLESMFASFLAHFLSIRQILPPDQFPLKNNFPHLSPDIRLSVFYMSLRDNQIVCLLIFQCLCVSGSGWWEGGFPSSFRVLSYIEGFNASVSGVVLGTYVKISHYDP